MDGAGQQCIGVASVCERCCSGQGCMEGSVGQEERWCGSGKVYESSAC